MRFPMILPFPHAIKTITRNVFPGSGYPEQILLQDNLLIHSFTQRLIGIYEVNRVVSGAIPVRWNCFIQIYDPQEASFNIFPENLIFVYKSLL